MMKIMPIVVIINSVSISHSYCIHDTCMFINRVMIFVLSKKRYFEPKTHGVR